MSVVALCRVYCVRGVKSSLGPGAGPTNGGLFLSSLVLLIGCCGLCAACASCVPCASLVVEPPTHSPHTHTRETAHPQTRTRRGAARAAPREPRDRPASAYFVWYMPTCSHSIGLHATRVCTSCTDPMTPIHSFNLPTATLRELLPDPTGPTAVAVPRRVFCRQTKTQRLAARTSVVLA